MTKTYPGNRRGKYRSQGALPEDWYVVRVRVVRIGRGVAVADRNHPAYRRLAFPTITVTGARSCATCLPSPLVHPLCHCQIMIEWMQSLVNASCPLPVSLAWPMQFRRDAASR